MKKRIVIYNYFITYVLSGTSPSKGEKHIDPPQQQPSPASVKRPPKPMKAMPEK